jgi:hypothetical protein
MNFVQYQSCHGIINTARTNSSPNRKVRVHFWHSEGPPSELLSPSASARFVEPRQSRPFFLALSFFAARPALPLHSCTGPYRVLQLPPEPQTSCAIRGARGGDIVHRSPPGSSGELGWAGCGPGGPTWPRGRLVRWTVTPTGTGAGSSVPPPYRRLPAGA